MHPRISAGDLVLFYRLNNEYISGDVILYNYKNNMYLGRVIGVPGDHVEITLDGDIKINDSIFVENDIFYDTYRIDSDLEYPIYLSDNQYFVLADNRDSGLDSRYFGILDKKDIKGSLLILMRRNNF